MTRVLVVGAGAMGSAMGALMAAAGDDVTLLDINAAHMAAIESSGLTIHHSDDRVENHRVALATVDPTAVGAADIVVVMTKSWATTEAVRSVDHAIGRHTWVVSAQNGLGNGPRMAAAVPESQVMAGTTTVGATPVEPGVVTVTATVTEGSSLTQFGLPEDCEDPATARIVADTFTRAGLRAEVLPDVNQVVWTKAAMAGTAGCLTAVAQLTIGDMVASPEAMQTWRQMIDELFAVAAAEGVSLDEDAVAEHALTTYRTVGAHWSSMAVDIRERRRTEVDALCGEISRLGAEHGIPTPVNDTITNLMRAIERSWTDAD